MKFRITDDDNFLRVFRLPNDYPSDFCFQGGHPVMIELVDWFNPFPVAEFYGGKVKEFENTEAWYLKRIEELKQYIKGKVYFKPEYSYLVLTNYGDAFVVNPQLEAEND